MRTRILVIDDEEPICELLQYNLEKQGYDVDCAYSAEEALSHDLSQYSLIISDIMMDRMSGFDFARRIKNSAQTENIPLIFCSALTGEDETVMGLNIGADDYIPKPFEIPVVIARVNAVLRRSQARHQVETIHRPVSAPAVKTHTDTDIAYRTLRIDQNVKSAFIDGHPLELTPREYDILTFFLTHPNKIYSRDEIVSQVWNGQNVASRAVDTNLARLRRKLGQYGNNIITKPGFGYGFKEEL